MFGPLTLLKNIRVLTQSSLATPAVECELRGRESARWEMVLNLQFSRWTFFKHLTTPKSTTLCKCQHKSTANFSHFGTLNSRQKDQIHLYVDALLQWNQVFSFPRSQLHITNNNALTLNLLLTLACCNCNRNCNCSA